MPALLAAPPSNPQVCGEVILPLITGRGALENMIRSILAEHGLAAPQAANWYPLQNYLEVHSALAATVGPLTLKSIGRKVAVRLLRPGGSKSMAEALAALDAAHHMHHRGGETGHYYFEQTGDRLAVIVCDTPYPCPFDWGLIEATAKMSAPLEAVVIVHHDNRRHCRQSGGSTCTYQISW